MQCVSDKYAQSLPGRIAGRAVKWSGLGSGLVLTAVLAYIGVTMQGHGRSLLAVMVAANLLMLAFGAWRAFPVWLRAGLSVARGFHWTVNLMFGCLALVLLFHASSPKRALTLGIVSMMFVLWAAAARRLTQGHDQVAVA